MLSKLKSYLFVYDGIALRMNGYNGSFVVPVQVRPDDAVGSQCTKNSASCGCSLPQIRHFCLLTKPLSVLSEKDLLRNPLTLQICTRLVGSDIWQMAGLYFAKLEIGQLLSEENLIPSCRCPVFANCQYTWNPSFWSFLWTIT